MEEAKQKAASEDKNVFLMFSTTSCGWCKVLKAFLESDEIKPTFTKYFVPVQLMLGNDANTNPAPLFTTRNTARHKAFPSTHFSHPTAKKSSTQTRTAPAETSAIQPPRTKSPGSCRW